MAYLKPQSPLKDAQTGNYIYPLTTIDQVVMNDGSRLNTVFKYTVKTTVTLSASGWSGEAPYVHTIVLDENVDDFSVDANVVYSGNLEADKALNEAASYLSYVKKDGNNIVFYCLRNKPEVDIPVEIKCASTGNIANVVVEEGVKLNFEVVGSVVEPASPTENMIWINTDVEIAGYKFSATEPENPIEGMAWITVGNSSAVSFSMIDDDSVTIYPLSAKQYVSGAWVSVETKSYQGGVWVDWWNGDLFDNGEQFESITGGWVKGQNKAFDVDSVNSGTISVTDTITLKHNGNPSASALTARTAKKINLKGYTTLTIEGTVGVGFYLMIDNDETGVPIAVTEASKSLSLSGAPDECYICLSVRNSASATITKVKLER